MRIGSKALSLVALASFATALSDVDARAQQPPDRIALKSGESLDLHPVYWTANCRSIMIGLPQVEILEGPPELTLSIKEEMVLPHRQNCPNKVPGGTLVVTAKDVKEPVVAKFTYRINYKTKDGDRQRGVVYMVSLFP